MGMGMGWVWVHVLYILIDNNSRVSLSTYEVPHMVCLPDNEMEDWILFFCQK